MWTSDESAYLSHLFGGQRIRKVLERARRQPRPSWISTEGVSDEEFLAYLGLGLNALYSSRSGGKRWIDQTPLNTLMVEDVGAMFPDAAFIHVLRDGRRVVHSMLHFLDKFPEERREEMAEHIGPWTTDFREACRSWAGYVDAATAFCRAHPDRCFAVANERLSADPEGTFRGMFDFLGVPYEERPIRHFRRHRKNSSFATEWRGDHPETLAEPEPWLGWSGERRRAFVEEAGEAMTRAGLALGDDFLVDVAAPGSAST
jgi:hypothetical protein